MLMGLCIYLLAGTIFTVPAKAAGPSPVAVSLAEQAIQNFQVIEIVGTAAKTGMFSDWKKSKSAKERLAKAFDGEIRRATPTILNRLAKKQAKKYSEQELRDIVAITSIPYFQKVMLAALNNAPEPPDSELSLEERKVMDLLGDKSYVNSFMNEVIKSDIKDVELPGIIERAVKKSR